MATICRIYGEVKIKQQYRCEVCCTTATGDSKTVLLDHASVEDVADQLNRLPLRAHLMPVGWASFLGPHGSTVFRCPDCLHDNH